MSSSIGLRMSFLSSTCTRHPLPVQKVAADTSCWTWAEPAAAPEAQDSPSMHLAPTSRQTPNCRLQAQAHRGAHLARDDEHEGATAVALDVRRRIPQVADELLQI